LFTLKYKNHFPFYNVNVLHYKSIFNNNIIFIKTTDKNYDAAVSVKTIPANNKGIPHVLEHILFAGSENYNVKDSFSEIIKNSLYSYVNGITYTDKTIYPFSSYDLEEFNKILDIYLDSIFFPRLDKGAFFQEGIFKNKDNGIFKDEKNNFSGIVYNEMSGFFANEFEKLKFNNYKNLFKNTPNEYTAAGLPEDIKTLDFNDVKAYYDENYILENMDFYFYGNLDENFYLELLEKKYFSKFESVKNIPIVNHNIEKPSKFHISKLLNDILLSVIVGKSFSFEDLTVAEIFTKKFNETAENIIAHIDKDNFYIVINFYKMNNKVAPLEYKKEIFEIFNKINFNSGDFNTYKFNLTEENYGYKTRGLGLIFMILNSVLYGDDYFSFFDAEKQIESMKTNLCLFDFLNKIFMNNDFANFTSDNLEENFQNKTENLMLSKTSQDDFAILEKFRNKKDDFYELEKFKIKNKKFLIDRIFEDSKNHAVNEHTFFYNCPSDKIFYLKFHYGTKILDDNELYLLPFLEKILKKNNSEFFEFEFTDNVFINNKQNHEFLTLNMKGVTQNIHNIFNEHKKFTNLEINNFDKMEFENIYNSVVTNFHNRQNKKSLEFAVNKAYSGFHNEFYNLEKIKYSEFEKFITENTLKANVFFDSLEKIRKKIFNNLRYVSVCANDKHFKDFGLVSDNYSFKRFDDKNFSEKTFSLSPRNRKNNFENFNKSEDNFTNVYYLKNTTEIKLDIFAPIIENEILYKKVRLIGGAYGYGCKVVNKNNLLMYSFNDKNQNETFEIFNNVFEILKTEFKNGKLNEELFENYKITLINEFYKEQNYFKTFTKNVGDFFCDNNFDAEILNLSFENFEEMINKFLSTDKVFSYVIN